MVSVGMSHFFHDAQTTVSHSHYLVSVMTTKKLYWAVGSRSWLFHDLHEPALGNAGMWKLTCFNCLGLGEK
jgi:hypothetical protein